MLWYSRKFVRTQEMFQELRHTCVLLQEKTSSTLLTLRFVSSELWSALRLIVPRHPSDREPTESWLKPLTEHKHYEALTVSTTGTASTRANQRPCFHTSRTITTSTGITLLGWPSKGGLISLPNAQIPHFDFLDISRLSPPTCRAVTPSLEDQFCQRLLLLGATWFDSQERWHLANTLAMENEQAISQVASGDVAPLTLTERLRVEVAWADDRAAPAGEFWIGEWDTRVEEGTLRHEKIPEEIARLGLAVSMAERCEILRSFRGVRWYGSVGEYTGRACLRLWDRNWKGESGPLEQTWLREGTGSLVAWDHL